MSISHTGRPASAGDPNLSVTSAMILGSCLLLRLCQYGVGKPFRHKAAVDLVYNLCRRFMGEPGRKAALHGQGTMTSTKILFTVSLAGCWPALACEWQEKHKTSVFQGEALEIQVRLG